MRIELDFQSYASNLVSILESKIVSKKKKKKESMDVESHLLEYSHKNLHHVVFDIIQLFLFLIDRDLPWYNSNQVPVNIHNLREAFLEL
jgi:hypothetical protein